MSQGLDGTLEDNASQKLSAARNIQGFDYATMKVRGVNLGGWLVLEREWYSM